MRITNFFKSTNLFIVTFILVAGFQLFSKPAVIHAQCGSTCSQTSPGICSLSGQYASSCGTGTGSCNCLFATGCNYNGISCNQTYVQGPAPAACCGGVSCTGTPGCNAPGDCVGGHLCQPGSPPCDSVLINNGPACGGGGGCVSTPGCTGAGVCVGGSTCVQIAPGCFKNTGPACGGGGSSCGGGNNPQCVAGPNCGVVGKSPGSGSCPAGQLCCVDTVGYVPGCPWTDNRPFCVGEGSQPINGTCSGGPRNGQSCGSSPQCAPGWCAGAAGCCAGLAPGFNGACLCPQPPAPTLTFTANGATSTTIPYNSSVNLVWTSTNTTSCLATGSWLGAKATSGSQPTGNLTSSQSYTLTCIGAGGSTFVTVAVNIITPQCASPVPKDPPVASCAPCPACQGSVTWQWNTVSSATQYQVRIYDATTNNQIIDSGLLPSATFSCAVGGICTYTTINMNVGSYYSRIMAAGMPACSLSALSAPSATVNVTVCLASAWWQCGDGDAYAGGNITSKIPFSCTSPACTPSLITNSLNTSPGVVTYGGNVNYGTGGGNASSTNWNANTNYSGKQYDYSYFSSLIPPAVLADSNFNLNSGTANSGTLNVGGSSYGGYRWYKRVGDLTITNPVNINGKVILFVEGGNLNINDKITLNSSGSDFFLAMTERDINVLGTVSNNTNPALTGLFFSGGTFNTGVSANELVIKGAVVANSVNFQRDLVGGNNTTPAEFVQYDPSQLLNFPKQLSRRNVIWKEVAP